MESKEKGMTNEGTLAEVEEKEEGYSWGYGVITRLSRREKEKLKHKKICAICGKERELTHEKLSGGVKSFICGECASEYVKNAERVKAKHGMVD